MLRLGREQGAQSRLQQSWVCSSVTPEPGLGWTLPHSRALWGFGVLRWTFWVYPFSSPKKFSSCGLECVWNLGCILYWSFQCLFAPLCLLIQLQTCPCRGWILLCSCPEARALAAVLSLSVWADTGRTGEQPQSLGGMAKGKFVFILPQAGGIRHRQVPQEQLLAEDLWPCWCHLCPRDTQSCGLPWALILPTAGQGSQAAGMVSPVLCYPNTDVLPVKHSRLSNNQDDVCVLHPSCKSLGYA